MREDIPDLEQESSQFPRYWRLLKRHKWWVVLPAFSVFAIVWVVSWFIPATYRSETLILVEQQKVPNEYVVPNIADDLQQRLQSMTQQILSRTRLIRVIDEFGLYPAERKRLSDDELLVKMRKDIQIELVREAGRDLSAFKIAYLSASPYTARAVTSQLSLLFIEENLRVRQERSENTTEFLDNELLQARAGLSAQESRVREFKSHYLGELPGQVQSNVQILSGLQSRMQQEMDALSHAKQQSVYLESMLSQFRGAEAGLRANTGNNAQSPITLDQEVERLQTELTQLTSKYSEEHPDVVKLRNQLAKTQRLKEQRDDKIAEAAKSAPATDTPRAASYAELQAMSPRLQVESELKANRLEVENRQRSIRDIERQIDSYQSRLNTTPLREQQLADLTRDYDQSRKNYEQLLAKRDESSMATNLEKRQQGEQFRVVDPANLPQKPYSPNRLKLALMGLIAGMGCGIGFMAGIVILDDGIYLREELQSVISAPVLVEIPPLLTIDETTRAKRVAVLQGIGLAAITILTTAGFGISYYLG